MECRLIHHIGEFISQQFLFLSVREQFDIAVGTRSTPIMTFKLFHHPLDLRCMTVI